VPKVLQQRFRDGAIELIEAPRPQPAAHELLVESVASVISAGTERMLVDFGRSSLVGKARKQPERVAEVLRKVQTDGATATYRAIQSKLDTPTTLGYANAGIVRAVGSAVRGFEVGDLVATNGEHGEAVIVPATMAAKVPAGVRPDHAAFATIASIGLQGIRLVEPTLGEAHAVVGLGLVGLLAVQLLQSAGCTVLGIDPSPDRRQLAQGFGAEVSAPGPAALHAAERLTAGLGLDGVVICASTASDEPVHEAAQMCRQRGRIVLVGVTGLDLKRDDFYAKELSFQVSASYGPGRYDSAYEDKGLDYPAGLVRWTAGRNMAAVLREMQRGRLDIEPLITHTFQLDEAAEAYSSLLEDPSVLGTVIRYGTGSTAEAERPERPRRSTGQGPLDWNRQSAPGVVGVIGAGGFTTSVLIPSLLAAGAQLRTVASRSGTTAAAAAARFGAERSDSSIDAVFEDPEIDTVVISTRHDTHAEFVRRGLEAGKNLLVEKPLAITHEEHDALAELIQRLADEGALPLLSVGFNRRFAPANQWMKSHIDRQAGPLTINMTMNVGRIDAKHWTQDPLVGGGRIIGEGCHMVDLARSLAGHPIVSCSTNWIESPERDSAVITLRFADGSLATLSYLATGSQRYPKERLEVFRGGAVGVVDNFVKAQFYGPSRTRRRPSLNQDKGHNAYADAFMTAVRTGGPAPIPIGELLDSSYWTLEAALPRASTATNPVP
jgi:predicted dehydrogenase/threonine dehydrogenase-like Zn-dependent dehydrogenase